MTRHYARLGIDHARCRACDGDLIVATDGKVYCSEPECRYHKTPHWLRSRPSRKGARA